MIAHPLTPSRTTVVSRRKLGRWSALAFTVASALLAPGLRASEDDGAKLAENFATPPARAKPGVYWWWLDGKVNRAGITRDLEALAGQGIGEVLLVNSANLQPSPPDPTAVPFLSPAWRELNRHALSEAKRLGLAVGVNLCGGWCMGGPWIPPEHSGRWFLQSRLTVVGPKALTERLPLPGGRDGYDHVFNPPGFKEYIDLPLEKLDYRDTAVVAFREPDSGTARFDAARRKLLPAKTNRRDASNFTRARDVVGPTLVPWATAEGDHPIAAADVVDLTGRLKPDGTLDWQVPEGRWTIIRTGHRMTGSRVMIPPPEVDGLSVDWLASEGVDLQMKHLGSVFLEDARAAGLTLRYFCDDSFEDGFPNWTEKIVERFKAYRGYDPVPYLPILAGYIVGSAEISDRFLADYRRTVADCMADGHYGTFAERCHALGLQVQNESAGPSRSGTMCMDGLMNLGRSDLPMGEFWLGLRHDEEGGLEPKLGYGVTRLEDGQNKVTKMVASAAHTYGRTLASAEAFTSNRHWLDSPATLKPAADRAFCEGINRLIVHESSATRLEDGLPGYEYYAGTHFNVNQTWWPMVGPFLQYLARCQYLLQQGRFVADVLYYHGDSAPNLVEPKHVPADLGAGYDYDVCNAEVLLNRVRVQAGRLVLPDGMSYRVLVLPETSRMSVPVARRIRELVDGGATVIGPRPQQASGLTGYPQSDEELRQIASAVWGDLDGQTRTEKKVGHGRVYWGRSAREVLAADGVTPDFRPDGGAGALDFIHRSLPDAEIYFVVNRERRPQDVACTFRVTDARPERWDAVTAERRALPARSDASGTTVRLTFAPQESCFIIFSRQATDRSVTVEDVSHQEARLTQEVGGPWTVAFDPKWGGPRNVEFRTLTDWSQSTDPGIRFYSGTATYRTTFTVDAKTAATSSVWLQLGLVKDIAAVRLNGKRIGIVWTAPWQIEVSRALREGENVLEVDVANLWRNRVIGDRGLPPAERLTRTNITLPADATLLPSGLLGPVSLKVGR